MKNFVLSLALVLLAGSAFGATTPNSFVAAQTPKLALVQFLQGTDTAGTYKTLYTGNANGTKISGLWMNNNDPSAAHLVTCQIVRSAVLYGGVAITSVASAGFSNTSPPQNLMSSTSWPGLPVDGNGNPYIYLASASDSLQCTFATALTSTDLINVGAIVSDF